MLLGCKKFASFAVARCTAGCWSFNVKNGLHAAAREIEKDVGLCVHMPVTSVVPTVFGFKFNAYGFYTTVARLSTSSQACKRRSDAGSEHMINSHFSNPLNKHLDYEDNTQKSLEEIAREQRRKIKSLKRARAAREFRKGPEKRTLSWDTIDQIHYLHQENPVEWSVAMLAESFNVSEDVIAKVLKSKFRPNAKVKEKQDQIAAENAGYVASGKHSQALVDPGTEMAQATSGHRNCGDTFDSKKQKMRWENKPSPKATSTVQSNSTKNVNLGQTSRHHQKIHAADTTKLQNQSRNRKSSQAQLIEEDNKDERDIEMEFSFGQFDFENVDSLMGQVKLKPQVIQKGRNFYNENGEFLYRI